MLQDSKSDLPGENTRDQQVINSFFNLVAKRTSTWVGKAFSSQAIGCYGLKQKKSFKRAY